MEEEAFGANEFDLDSDLAILKNGKRVMEDSFIDTQQSKRVKPFSFSQI
jgi:hypothetical protein